MTTEVGATKALLPIYDKLSHRYKVEFYGTKNIRNYLEQYDIKVKKESEITENLSEVLFVLTGASLAFTEKSIWKIMKKNSIYCGTIVDFWSSIEKRFLDEITDDIVYPDVIFTIDQYMTDRLISYGIPQKVMKLVGQPYFEMIQKKYHKPRKCNNQEINFLFASQPISLVYGDYLGFDEFSILREVIDAVSHIDRGGDKILRVRLHPDQPLECFDHIIEGTNLDDGYKVFVDEIDDVYQSLIRSDIVIGMFSSVLYEARLLQIPSMSVVIGDNGKVSRDLENAGYFKGILSKDLLIEELNKIVIDEAYSFGAFASMVGSTNKIINYVEDIICQN